MIDTHAHIYLPNFEEDRQDMIDRMEAAGVSCVYLPNIDVASIEQVKTLAVFDENRFRPMMGLHPCSVKEDYRKQLQLIEAELDTGIYFGVGEIGLDYYWDKTFIDEQKEAYLIQIEWARARDLPFVIHSRDSLDDTIGMVESLQNGSLRGVYHCFNGTLEQARRIMDLGFYMGIGGVVTFKNAGVDRVVKEIPMEYLVLETDAPYLTPVPFRGKRNEPSYLTYIVQRIAEVKDLPVNEVVRITTENADRLFVTQEV